MLRSKLSSIGFSLLVALILAAPASASVIIPYGYDFTVDVYDASGTTLVGSTNATLLNQADMLSLTYDSTYDTYSMALTGPTSVAGTLIESWGSDYKIDPFVTNNVQIVNNSGVTQTYVIGVISPVAPPLFPSQIIQSNVLVQINDDDNLGGATLNDAFGAPVYRATVNNNPLGVLDLLSAPYTLSCTSPFDCAVLGNGQDAAGILSQGYVGPSPATSIGITLSFQLSPGDSASLQSRFEIIPEPALGILVGLGLVSLAVARRRS